MKKIIYYTKIIIIAITFTGIVSCVDDDDNGNIIDNIPSNSILDITINNPDFSTLLDALQQTGLDATLANSGTFTIFAPTNTAFEAFLGDTLLEDIDNDLLTQILLNHVLNVEIASTDLVTGFQKNLATEASTNANLDMYIDTSSGIVINNQSTVTDMDIDADNGIVHIVDTIIELPNLATFATIAPSLNTFVTALTDEGNTTFIDLFSDIDSDFTVFAPTNEAFTNFLGSNTLDDIDNDDLALLLSNHILSNTVAISTALTNSYLSTNATFNGEEDAPISMYINIDNGIVVNGSTNISQTDIVAVNGVIHITDAVIEFPDVTTFVLADPMFSTLVSAMTADASFDFVETLQTPNGTMPAPFTVFAPTNNAFDDLILDLDLTSLDEIPLPTLQSTIELHIVPDSNVRSEDLIAIDGTTITTLGGSSITVDAATPAIIDPDGGSNNIIITNAQATNGVIQIVNRIIRDL